MRRWIALLLVVLLPLKSVAAPGILITGPTGHAHAGATAFGQSAAAMQDTAANSAKKTDAQAHDGSAATGSSHHAAEAAHAGCPMFAASAGNASDDTPHDHPCPHMGMAFIPAAVGLGPPPGMRHDRTLAPVAHFASITLDVPSPPPTSILV